MDTKKYDNRWSYGYDEKGNFVWIDRQEKKAHKPTWTGGAGEERKDIAVVSNGD